MYSDLFLTLLIPLFLLFVVLWKSQRSLEDNFFSKDYTTILKGVCAIDVMLVHVNPLYQNSLQDALGSFAYVAVTIFFLISAYGMQLSAGKKPDYLKHFWQNRLSSLLVPCFLVNILVWSWRAFVLKDWDFFALFKIDMYVQVLLQYCLLFYVVMALHQRFKMNVWVVDSMLVLCVLASSLYLYLNNNVTGWCYERWGLIWGVLFYRFNFYIVKWLNSSRMMKIVFSFLLCGVLGVLYLKFKTEWFYGEYLLKIVLGVSLITLLFFSSQRIVVGNGVGRFLGNISYEIYLSHGFVMGIVAYLFPKLSSGLFLLVSLVITVLFSWLLHETGQRIVKRIRAN